MDLLPGGAIDPQLFFRGGQLRTPRCAHRRLVSEHRRRTAQHTNIAGLKPNRNLGAWGYLKYKVVGYHGPGGDFDRAGLHDALVCDRMIRG
jgi:hypothetical protein